MPRKVAPKAVELAEPAPAPAPAEDVAAPAPAAAQPELDPEIEVVPAPRPDGRTVTFILDEGAEAGAEAYVSEDPEDPEEYENPEDAPEEDDYEDEDPLAAAVGQLTQLLMTEEGEAMTDVLAGMRDSLDKLNRILFRGLQLLESQSQFEESAKREQRDRGQQRHR
jgi:hypothetical protein